jgi:hypothetical protein
VVKPNSKAVADLPRLRFWQDIYIKVQFSIYFAVSFASGRGIMIKYLLNSAFEDI